MIGVSSGTISVTEAIISSAFFSFENKAASELSREETSDLGIGGKDHHNDKYYRVDEHTVIGKAASGFSECFGEICQDNGGNDAASDAAYTAEHDKHEDQDREVIIELGSLEY